MEYIDIIFPSSEFIFTLFFTFFIFTGFSTLSAQAYNYEMPEFNSGNFSDPTNINNDYLTLTPGTAFCYSADTEDGTEINQVTVTDCDLQIAGVDVVVVRDAVRLDDGETVELTEDTYDFYAQDDDGNVWYLGEATKECEEGGTTEGSWNADDPDAAPGIVMLANPLPGESYMQEFLEDVAQDQAKVLRLNSNVSEDCDQDCLATKEWTTLEPGEIEHKYYAHDTHFAEGTGGVLVLTEELKGKTVLSELTDVQQVEDTGSCPSVANMFNGICSDASQPDDVCSGD